MSMSVKENTREALQLEGRSAYSNGADDESPYPYGTDESQFWHEGYDDAKEEDNTSDSDFNP